MGGKIPAIEQALVGFSITLFRENFSQTATVVVTTKASLENQQG